MKPEDAWIEIKHWKSPSPDFTSTTSEAYEMMFPETTRTGLVDHLSYKVARFITRDEP